MPTTRHRWPFTRSSAFSESGCFPAWPIDTAAGPTPSWCSAHSGPVRPSRRSYPALVDEWLERQRNSMAGGGLALEAIGARRRQLRQDLRIVVADGQAGFGISPLAAGVE